MKRSLLESAFKEKTLIGIRTNAQDWGESIIGFIVKLEDSFFTINEIDEYGAYIGNTTIEIENIINIDINDRYQKRLKLIHDHVSTFNVNNRITVWKESSTLIHYFKDLMESVTIVTFYFNEDDYVTGVILKYDENQIMINNIGSEGDEDGISCHYINHLMGLRYNSLEEQKIKLLYDNRVLFYSPPG
jgi:hypothetical protein